jgi:hypothetical protein
MSQPLLHALSSCTFKYSMAFAVQLAETKWHGTVPDLMTILSLYICIATVVGRWQLMWVLLWQVIFLDITLVISVTRLSGM